MALSLLTRRIKNNIYVYFNINVCIISLKYQANKLSQMKKYIFILLKVFQDKSKRGAFDMLEKYVQKALK